MRHRYVTLATAAIEQLEAAKVAASCAPAATAAVDPSALLKSDTNMLPKIPSELPSNNSKAALGPVSPALENDHVIAEAVDIELSAEAVQLRRKRLEVDAFAVFVLFVVIATELCGYTRRTNCVAGFVITTS